ncbi:uncharacterized protein [Macrobrachium rosenbergii]|uniref:uncharacterized protein isoform X1 n=2 Tax=Macrobrachium rosenbergii TaxID=79674 RepID=UPI0034D61F0F
MTEQGRPWWNTSEVNGSVCGAVKQSPASKKVPKPGEPPVVLVKKEPVNSSPPSPLCKPSKFSPVLFTSAKNSSAMNSVVKTEPPDIKSEPMAYIERALVKGEFPRDFNWPQIKWEPLVMQNHIKNETKQKHYIPKPLSEMELKLRYTAPRRRNGPPPDWHYIYTRDTHEPRAAARSWWNTGVERALNKRREAYLQTKLNDNAPIEVRMERIWAFEVAKDEVRRVIADSKWKAAMHGSGNIQGSDTLNFGASTSRDTGCVAAGKTLRVQDRLGHLPTVGDIGSGKNENNKESPIGEETEDINPDDIQVIPHSQENVEVLTLDDEIEDAMSSSEDDSDDIRIVGELGSDDVIFIQKRQGEVTFLAQVNGRFIKMNRKRKLCVTVSNTLNTKRKRVVNVEDESGNVDDENGEQLTNCIEQTKVVSHTDSLLASDVTESMDLTENKSDGTTSGKCISDDTSDSQINNIQECSMMEAKKKNVLRNENFLDCHNLSAESESVIPFKFSAENASVAGKKGYSGIQLWQEQITADILSENESSNSVIYDIQEVSVSDDESKYIDSSTQKFTRKEKEAHENYKVGDEIFINRIVNDKQGVESLHSKEDIIVLETFKGTYSTIKGDVCVKREESKVIMEEKEEEISPQENNPEEDCDLKEDFVEIHCSLTADKKRKTEDSTGEVTCEIGSNVSEEENKNIDMKMVKGASDPDDVLEIDVVEEEMTEKDDTISECGEGYNSVEECEKEGDMFVNKKGDTYCGLKSQINDKKISLEESSNSCDVEVVDAFDEEVEIVQESSMLQKNKGTPNTRQKTGENSHIRITRQSAILGNGKQHSEKKETKRKLSYNSGIRTRSKRY